MIGRWAAWAVALCFLAPAALYPDRIAASQFSNTAKPIEVDLADFGFLFNHVSAISRFSIEPYALEAEQSTIIDASCDVFSELIKEDSFRRSLGYLSETSNYEQLLPEIEQTYTEFADFWEFLQSEREILLNAGLEDSDIDPILGKIVSVRSMMSEFEMNATESLGQLEVFTGQVCEAAFRAEDVDKTMLAWKSVFVTFGSAVIIADIAIAFIPGAGPVVATSSGLFGGLILNLALGLM